MWKFFAVLALMTIMSWYTFKMDPRDFGDKMVINLTLFLSVVCTHPHLSLSPLLRLSLTSTSPSLFLSGCIFVCDRQRTAEGPLLHHRRLDDDWCLRFHLFCWYVTSPSPSLPLPLPLLLSHFNHKTSATQNFVVWLLCAGNNPLYLTVDTWSCIAFPVASLLYPFAFCFFVISFFLFFLLSFFLLICFDMYQVCPDVDAGDTKEEGEEEGGVSPAPAHLLQGQGRDQLEVIL